MDCIPNALNITCYMSNDNYKKKSLTLVQNHQNNQFCLIYMAKNGYNKKIKFLHIFAITYTYLPMIWKVVTFTN